MHVSFEVPGHRRLVGYIFAAEPEWTTNGSIFRFAVVKPSVLDRLDQPPIFQQFDQAIELGDVPNLLAPVHIQNMEGVADPANQHEYSEVVSLFLRGAEISSDDQAIVFPDVEWRLSFPNPFRVDRVLTHSDNLVLVLQGKTQGVGVSHTQKVGQGPHRFPVGFLPRLGLDQGRLSNNSPPSLFIEMRNLDVVRPLQVPNVQRPPALKDRRQDSSRPVTSHVFPDVGVFDRLWGFDNIVKDHDFRSF